MLSKRNGRTLNYILLLILVTGVCARVALALASIDQFYAEEYSGLHDIKAWLNAGELILEGRNPYTESYILDFAPVWAWISAIPVGIAGKFGLGSFIASVFIKLILTGADLVLVIFLIGICRRRGTNPLIPAALFFLNPVSIVTTGYLGQFDNVSLIPIVIFAYIMTRWGRNDQINSKVKAAKTGFLLGISLAVKHASGPIILFLPRVFSDMKKYALSLLIALSVFFVLFLPYIIEGGIGSIIEDVFGQQQRAFGTGWFWIWKLFGGFPSATLQKILFISALLCSALLVWRKKHSYLQAISIYYISIMLFVPSFARHYMIYPLLFGVMTYPVSTAIYTITSTLYLLSSGHFSGPLAFINGPIPSWPLFLVLLGWWIWAIVFRCRSPEGNDCSVLF